MKKFIFIAVLLLAKLIANDLSDGVRAYKANNYAKAIEIFKKSCENKNAMACGILGAMYESAQSVSYDKELAKKYFIKACDLGDQDACEFIKTANKKDKIASGVSAYKANDYQKASEYYEKACNSWHAKACYNLGNLYFKGLGLSQDHQKTSEF